MIILFINKMGSKIIALISRALVNAPVPEQDVAAAVVALGGVPGEVDFLGAVEGDEVLRPGLGAEEDVVVEVGEVAAQAGDAVDVGLDRGGGEDGELALVREDGRVGHHGEPRVGRVEPAWDLVVG